MVAHQEVEIALWFSGVRPDPRQLARNPYPMVQCQRMFLWGNLAHSPLRPRWETSSPATSTHLRPADRSRRMEIMPAKFSLEITRRESNQPNESRQHPDNENREGAGPCKNNMILAWSCRLRFSTKNESISSKCCSWILGRS
jgi:hypothetical protein